MTPEYFNENDVEHLPGLLGIEVTDVQKGRLEARLALSKKHLALNAYLHADRTTQVWESSVFSELTEKMLAKFTCTQLILYPR